MQNLQTYVFKGFNSVVIIDIVKWFMLASRLHGMVKMRLYLTLHIIKGSHPGLNNPVWSLQFHHNLIEMSI